MLKKGRGIARCWRASYNLKQRNNVFLTNCKAAKTCNICKIKYSENTEANKPMILIHSLFPSIRSVCLSEHFWIWKTCQWCENWQTIP